MPKLCLLYNTAPLYRSAIFRKIDAEYDCDWYFGTTKSDIKEMDLSLLKRVYRYKSFGNPSKLYWQRTLIPLLFKKKYNTYFVLAETRSLSCWIFLFLARLLFPKKKIYTWGHGWYGKESRIETVIKLWMYRHMTGLFVYGDYAKRLIVEQGIDENKIFVIKNSLDYDKQLQIRKTIKPSPIFAEHFGNDRPTLLFIGRLTTVKHLDMLLDAVDILRKQGKAFNVTFVGGGEQKSYLEEYAVRLGITEQVWFYGPCYNEAENAQLIYNADLCVSPGNVGLTAMHVLMFGTPVITHDTFAYQMPEFEAITPGKTGEFFKQGDVDSLAETIAKWFDAKADKREDVRQDCYREIDTYWNPDYQMSVIRKNLKF